MGSFFSGGRVNFTSSVSSELRPFLIKIVDASTLTEDLVAVEYRREDEILF